MVEYEKDDFSDGGTKVQDVDKSWVFFGRITITAQTFQRLVHSLSDRVAFTYCDELANLMALVAKAEETKRNLVVSVVAKHTLKIATVAESKAKYLETAKMLLSSRSILTHPYTNPYKNNFSTVSDHEPLANLRRHSISEIYNVLSQLRLGSNILFINPVPSREGRMMD